MHACIRWIKYIQIQNKIKYINECLTFYAYTHTNCICLCRQQQNRIITPASAQRDAAKLVFAVFTYVCMHMHWNHLIAWLLLMICRHQASKIKQAYTCTHACIHAYTQGICYIKYNKVSIYIKTYENSRAKAAAAIKYLWNLFVRVMCWFLSRAHSAFGEKTYLYIFIPFFVFCFFLRFIFKLIIVGKGVYVWACVFTLSFFF